MNDSVPSATAPRANVLGVGIHAVEMDEAVEALVHAATTGRGGYVCVTGVHGVMEARRDPKLRRIHNRALMTVPDGMPTVWRGQEEGYLRMGRVYGPDLMARIFEATGEAISNDQQGMINDQGGGGEKRTEHRTSNIEHPTSNGDPGSASTRACACTHFLYGATEETLGRLKTRLEARYPGARIAGTYAPPFRELTEEEWGDVAARILDSGADFVWVGLSTPKQERFMAEFCRRAGAGGETAVAGGQNLNIEHRTSITDHRSRITGHRLPVLIGVGAAFDIHAGLRQDAPDWMKRAGLQWLHRLVQEPHRLWKRYLFIVPAFLILVLLQLLGAVEYELEGQ